MAADRDPADVMEMALDAWETGLRERREQIEKLEAEKKLLLVLVDDMDRNMVEIGRMTVNTAQSADNARTRIAAVLAKVKD